MPKPIGKVELNVFVEPELKAAIIRKCKANGWTMNYVANKLFTDWAADAPPAIESVAKQKRKRA